MLGPGAVLAPAAAGQEATHVAGNAEAEGVRIFDPAYFSKFSPVTAYDMVRQLPGFFIDNGASLRGFGKTNSPRTFGHNGAGGQLAWADPATGLSFIYLTNGLDRHMVRQARRGVALSSIAATVTS